DSTFTNNTVPSDRGGGIDNRGALTVSGSTFISNSAGGVGGGINTLGTATGSDTVTVSDCSFIGNFAGNEGGGIYIEPGLGRVTVRDSTFASNDGGDEGGGIDNGATLTVIDSTFTHNSADAVSGNGGGLNTEGGGTTTVIGSTFTHNSASAGGGIDNDGT